MKQSQGGRKDGIHYMTDKWEKKGNPKPSKDLQGLKCCVHLVQVVCKGRAELPQELLVLHRRGNSLPLHVGVPTRKRNNPELQD